MTPDNPQERLRARLNRIASWTQSTGLLWWQIEAREALADLPHEFQQNGPGIVGSDICTLCGKERDDHDAASRSIPAGEDAEEDTSELLTIAYMQGADAAERDAAARLSSISSELEQVRAENARLQGLTDGLDEERRGALDLCIERNKQIHQLEARLKEAEKNSNSQGKACK